MEKKKKETGSEESLTTGWSEEVRQRQRMMGVVGKKKTKGGQCGLVNSW